MNLRTAANRSRELVNEFLMRLQNQPLKVVQQIMPDWSTIDLNRYVPFKHYHNKLLLTFKPGPSGGAKFSLREDGKFSITIFLRHKPTDLPWQQFITKHMWDAFIERRGSYIHEFVHYLSVLQHPTPLETIQAPDPHGPESTYYNHPFEFIAFMEQGLDTAETALDSSSIAKLFSTMTQHQFAVKVKSKFFDQEFIRNLTNDNLDVLNKQVEQLYQEFTSNQTSLYENGLL